MNKFNKESLQKLLFLLDEICSGEENLWFKQALENRFSHFSDTNNQQIIVKLNLIEKYLSIDGLEIINYSEIENEAVKTQLIRDCIEMSKYRLGVINNIINFEEYCRYAHMQAEELLNYYYLRKFKNIKEIDDFIRVYGNYNPTSEPKNIHVIGHSFKLNAFVKSTGLDYKMKYYLDFVSKIRNEISHRNSFQIQDENKIMDSIYLKGINLDEFYDLTKLSKSEKILYFNAKVINEKRKKDFASIMIYLDYLKQAVILLLKNN